MFLEFSVNNFRSIKDTATLSMNAAMSMEGKHRFPVRNYQLLNSAAIYGANASGKSNVLLAMGFMRHLVLNKPKVTQSTDKLPHEPFRLSTETEHASSFFEMVFFVKESKYRYGFEADSTTVYAEWLYCDEKGQEARLFQRDLEQKLHYVNKARFKEGLRLKIPDNQLFIWKCDQNDGQIARSILQWFNNFNFINGLDSEQYFHVALQQMENASAKSDLLKLVKVADIGIEDIAIEEIDLSPEFIKNAPLSEEMKQKILSSGGLTGIELRTHHKKFNEKNELVDTVFFELDEDESLGTKKFFRLSAPILNTLEQGKILLIDELDASLHPKLTEYFIKLFHNKKFNTHNAQLIFVTHDTNLLSSPGLLERDQIWFTEKNQYGSTELYSLLEFRKNNPGKDVRASDNLEKHYLQGRFGAVPYLGDF